MVEEVDDVIVIEETPLMELEFVAKNGGCRNHIHMAIKPRDLSGEDLGEIAGRSPFFLTHYIHIHSFSLLIDMHARVTTFLYLPTKDKPRMLGIGGPLLFPDCLSDGKESHEVDATGMFMRTSSWVQAYLFSSDMSCQCRRPQRHSEIRKHIYEVERNNKPTRRRLGTEDSCMQIWKTTIRVRPVIA